MGVADWKEIDREHIWHPFTALQGKHPLMVKKAKGAYIYTEDGRKILDCVSSWWVNIHGHGHPKLARAIGKQAKQLEHVIFAGFTHAPAVQLTKNLLSIIPDKESKIFYSDNGSTATEIGIKIALQYFHNLGKPRKKVIAIEGAYHGDTFGAMSVGDRSTIFSQPFLDHMFDVVFLPFPGKNPEASIQKMKEEVDEDTAAFIFEPLVQGAAGMQMYSPETLDELISIAQSKEVICIADEVMTGFGRLGKTLACDYLMNKPEMFCLSKGLTGGFLAMGVTTITKKIADVFDERKVDKVFYHGHSYTANPMTCAVANASFEEFSKEKTSKNIKRIENRHKEFVQTIQVGSVIDEIRTFGTILAIEIKAEDAGYASSLKARIYDYFVSRDILLRPMGNVIYMIPPYIISDKDLKRTYAAIVEFIKELEMEAA